MASEITRQQQLIANIQFKWNLLHYRYGEQNRQPQTDFIFCSAFILFFFLAQLRKCAEDKQPQNKKTKTSQRKTLSNFAVCMKLHKKKQKELDKQNNVVSWLIFGINWNDVLD